MSTDAAATLTLEIVTAPAVVNVNNLTAAYERLHLEAAKPLPSVGGGTSGQASAETVQQIKTLEAQVATLHAAYDKLKAGGEEAAVALKTSMAGANSSIAHSLNVPAEAMSGLNAQMKAAAEGALAAFQRGMTNSNWLSDYNLVAGTEKNTVASLERIKLELVKAKAYMAEWGQAAAELKFGPNAFDPGFAAGVDNQLAQLKNAQIAKKANEELLASEKAFDAEVTALYAKRNGLIERMDMEAYASRTSASSKAHAELLASEKKYEDELKAMFAQRKALMEREEYAAWEARGSAQRKAQEESLALERKYLLASEEMRLKSAIQARKLMDGGYSGNLATEFAPQTIRTAGTSSLAALEAQLGRTNAAQAHWNTLAGEGNAAARGLAGSLGGLWLTYGSLVPLVAAAALATSLKSVFTVGKDVEYQFTYIQAITDGTVVSLNEFQKAIQDSMSTPVEAAGALRVLAQAGLSAQESLTALPAVLKLATTGEVDLGHAALASAAIMHTFSLSVNDISHIGDVFATAAKVSATSVKEMMEAMKQAAAISNVFGVSLEETAAALATLANRGIEGSAAGTAIRNMVKELSSPATDKAAYAMEQYGIQIFNADGSAKKFTTNLQQLADVTSVMTKETKAHFLEDLFNERGAKAANILLSDLEKMKTTLAEIEASSKGLGFMTEANIRLSQSTDGMLKQIKSGFETLMVDVFKEVEPQIKSILSSISELVKSSEFKATLVSMAEAVANFTLFLREHSTAVLSVIAAYAGFKVLGTLGATIISLSSPFLALSGAMGAGVPIATALAAVLTGPVAIGLGAVAIVAATVALKQGELDDAQRRVVESANALTEAQGRINTALTSGLSALSESNKLQAERIRLLREGKSAAEAAAGAMDNLGYASAKANKTKIGTDLEAAKAHLNSPQFAGQDINFNPSPAFDQAFNAVQALDKAFKQADRQLEASASDSIRAGMEGRTKTLQDVKEKNYAEVRSQNEKFEAIKRLASLSATELSEGKFYGKPETIEARKKTLQANIARGVAAERFAPLDQRTAESQATQVELQRREAFLSENSLAYARKEKEAKGGGGAKAAAKDAFGAEISALKGYIANYESEYSLFVAETKKLHEARNISEIQMIKANTEAKVQYLTAEMAVQEQVIARAGNEKNHSKEATEAATLYETLKTKRQIAQTEGDAAVLKATTTFGEQKVGLERALAGKLESEREKALITLKGQYAKLYDEASLNGDQDTITQLEQWKADFLRGADFKDLINGARLAMSETGSVIKDMEAQIANDGGWIARVTGFNGIQEYIDQQLPAIRAKMEAAKKLMDDVPVGQQPSDAISKGFLSARKEFDALNNYINPVWKDTVKMIDNTFHDAFQSIFKKGKTDWKAFTRSITDQLKTTLLDTLYQVFARKFVMNIVANVAGVFGVSGLAKAADAATADSASLSVGGVDVSSAASTMSSLKTAYDTITGGAQNTFTSLAKSGIGQQLGLSSVAQVETLSGGISAAENALTGVAGQSFAGSTISSVELTSLGTSIGSGLATAGAGLLGSAIGNAIAGDKRIIAGVGMSTVGAAAGAGIGMMVGAIGGPLGAIVGGALGGVLDAAFGRGQKEVKASGIQGTFAGTGFEGTGYSDWKQKGGWFRSDKKGTDFTPLEAGTSQALSDSFTLLKLQTGALAQTLGVNTQSIADYSKTVKLQLTEDATENSKLIADMIGGISDDLAKLALAGSDFGIAGETAAQTLTRLSTSLVAANQGLALAHLNTLGVSLAAGDMASTLITAMGGIDNFKKSISSYYDTYFSATEKQQDLVASLTNSFSAMGLVLPTSKAAFRSLVESLDLTTTSGEQTFAGLMSVSTAFATMTDAADAAASATANAAAASRADAVGLVDQYSSDQQRTTKAVIDLAIGFGKLGLSVPKTAEAYRALADSADTSTASGQALVAGLMALSPAFDTVQAASKTWADSMQAAQDAAIQAATAAQEKADSERESLQKQWDELMGNTVALRRAELAALDSSNHALQQKIWAYQDEKAALDLAVTASDAAFSVLQKAVEAQKKTQQDAVNAAQTAVDSVKSVFDVLKTEIDKLYGTANSAAAGQEFITRALAQVQAGGALPDVAELQNAISGAAGGFGDSASQFEADKGRLLLAGQLVQLKDLTGTRLTDSQATLKTAQDQLVATDNILTNAQTQLNMLRGINDSTLSVTDAVEALQVAMTGEKTARQRAAELALSSTSPSGGRTQEQADSDPTNVAATKVWAAARIGNLVEYLSESVGGNVNAAAVTSEIAAMRDYIANGTTQNLPSFAVGTSYVPQDMVAKVHKGEAIVPAAFNPARYSSASGNDALVTEIKALRAEVTALRAENTAQQTAIATNTGYSARVHRRWEGDGLPETRTTI